jgi:hypothetical protein
MVYQGTESLVGELAAKFGCNTPVTTALGVIGLSGMVSLNDDDFYNQRG